MRPSLSLRLLLLLFVSSSLAHAQRILHTFTGPGPYLQFGHSVAGVGDMNLDGMADLAVGAPKDAGVAGSVTVFSGFDGSVLFLHYGQGPPNLDGLGAAVAGAGDVDRDGYPDLIAGTMGPNTQPGYARVYSGKDGSILYTLDGDNTFGTAVDGVGDVDGDGYGDVIVGDYTDSTGWSLSGKAEVYAGKDGSKLFSILGTYINDYFGYSVSGAGDLDQDGLDDFLVGANQPAAIFFGGYVKAISGMDGSLLYTFAGAALDLFGNAVDGGRDVDGDGTPDIAVGAPQTGSGNGYAKVFSGRDGTTLLQFLGDTNAKTLGWSVGLEELDGDGIADVLLGGQGGLARAYAGADGRLLWNLPAGTPPGLLGFSVAGAGDVDADGIADAIVGVPDGCCTGSTPGSALVLGGCPDSFSTYGAGMAGLGGLIPRIDGGGCSQLGTLDTVEVSNGLGGTLGVLLLGPSPNFLQSLGGTLLVVPVVSVWHTLAGTSGIPGTGIFSLPFSIPSNPLLLGQSLYAQGIYLDPGAPLLVSMSPGLRLTVQ